MDGSGFTLTVSSSAGNTSIGNIYTSAGAIYTGDSLTDSNGNEISYAPSTGVFTDTMGMKGATAATGSVNVIGDATWTDTNGNTQTLAPTYTSYTLKSSFGCSGATDFTDAGIELPTSFSFPDTTTLGLSWEPNEVTSTDRTGRLSEITLRTGSTIQFNYNPGGASSAPYGFNCTYLVPNSLTRTTSDGTVTYNWAHLSGGGSQTTRLDIGKNKTIYKFSASGVLTEGQAFHNTGTVSLPTYGSTADLQTTYCYNSGNAPTVSSCPTATVTEPVTQLAVFTSPNGLSASETYSTFSCLRTLTLSENLGLRCRLNG